MIPPKNLLSGKHEHELLRRPGKFALGHSIDIEIWQYIMSQVLIVRCEFLFLTGIFVYEGLSYRFERVKSGEKSPWYTWKKNEHGVMVPEPNKPPYMEWHYVG